MNRRGFIVRLAAATMLLPVVGPSTPLFKNYVQGYKPDIWYECHINFLNGKVTMTPCDFPGKALCGQ